MLATYFPQFMITSCPRNKLYGLLRTSTAQLPRVFNTVLQSQ